MAPAPARHFTFTPFPGGRLIRQPPASQPGGAGVGSARASSRTRAWCTRDCACLTPLPAWPPRHPGPTHVHAPGPLAPIPPSFSRQTQCPSQRRGAGGAPSSDNLPHLPGPPHVHGRPHARAHAHAHPRPPTPTPPHTHRFASGRPAKAALLTVGQSCRLLAAGPRPSSQAPAAWPGALSIPCCLHTPSLNSGPARSAARDDCTRCMGAGALRSGRRRPLVRLLIPLRPRLSPPHATNLSTFSTDRQILHAPAPRAVSAMFLDDTGVRMLKAVAGGGPGWGPPPQRRCCQQARIWAPPSQAQAWVSKHGQPARHLSTCRPSGRAAHSSARPCTQPKQTQFKYVLVRRLQQQRDTAWAVWGCGWWHGRRGGTAALAEP